MLKMILYVLLKLLKFFLMYMFVTAEERSNCQHVNVEIIKARKIGVPVPRTPGGGHGN